ncbi:hypothetical protein CFOLD11_11780 [Clostridium folliculivorans]|uniref:DUF262 domain-containing protein n=1 Tax=Clostridium folliculivorans TaxID=2886038 RepID=A0A9W5Y0J0_9CLOT|nr:DUF262 domain-containing HNH endonuclease family protein [Clostridium folliculivorans]GKU24352.1 hypothetical protein CFOLD11_11780 [Clostridium folliculivorans]
MKLKTIDDLFNKRIYRIPSYQRGYAWANDSKNFLGQLSDIWDDILNIMDGWHYTGLITLMSSPLSDIALDDRWLLDYNFEQYYIVDGQQRLTTLLILIQVLLERAEEENISLSLMRSNEEIKEKYLINSKNTTPTFIFGYSNDNPSDKYFKRNILKVRGLIVDDSEESYYTENLRKAKEYFNNVVGKYIEEKADKSTSIQKLLSDIFNKVTNRLRFNEYILDEELNEYVVFETMNNRGKQLSELEKLKNRLMFLSTKLRNCSENEKEILRRDINTVWITIYKELGKNKSKPLDDEDFIRNHWIMYFGYDRKESNSYSRYLFDEMFTINNVYNDKLKLEDMRKYISSLQESAVVWSVVNNPQYYKTNNFSDLEVKLGLEKLHRVGIKASFKPAIMAALNYCDNEFIIKLLNLLEDFAFKIFDVSNRQSNTGDSKIYRHAFRIHSDHNSKENLDEAKESILRDIQEHIDYYFNIDHFKLKIKELFEKQSNGYYDWSGIRYFLYEYDEYLRNANNVTERSMKLDWRVFLEERSSIEHIFPQSGKEKSLGKWMQFNHLTDEQKARCCGSLGNLLGISNPKNSALNNDSFEEKKDQGIKGEAYMNRGYKFGSYSERIVAEYDNWTPETIFQRGIDMLDFLWKKLGIDQVEPLTIEDKKILLGLEFLNSKDIISEFMFDESLLEDSNSKEVNNIKSKGLEETDDLENKLREILMTQLTDGMYDNMNELAEYSEIQRFAMLKDITPEELLKEWGYKKRTNYKYCFDKAAAKKLIEEYNISYAELGRWLGYDEKSNSRALVRAKINGKRSESGAWTNHVLTAEENTLLHSMIIKHETEYEGDNFSLKIISNGNDICILFLCEDTIKCFFELPEDLKAALKEKDYYKFTSFDIDVLRTGKVETYLGKRLFRAEKNVGSRMKELGIDKAEEYFRYLGFDGALNGNQETDSIIRETLSKYLDTENIIYLPVNSEDYQRLNIRANREGYTLDEFAAYYGFIRRGRDSDNAKEKLIEKYKLELNENIVEGNKVYIPTASRLFYKLNGFCNNNNLKFNEFIKSLGFERIYV